LRGQRVLIDSDVAALYEVETKRVNEAVKNNPGKFPSDYMFELTEKEFDDLRSKFSTTKFAKVRVNAVSLANCFVLIEKASLFDPVPPWEFSVRADCLGCLNEYGS
jgi:hypothetical protein